MRVIFTTTDYPLSKLIRWMFNEPCSHFACTLYQDQVVFQSNLLGVDFGSFKAFSRKERVVFAFDFPMTKDEEDKVFDGIVERMVGNEYDFKALVYFGLRGLLKKLFRVPLPRTNAWQTKNQDLCTELAYGLPDSVVPPGIKAMDLSMKTPYKLYQMMKIWHEQGKIVEL